ncbi:MAG: 50S ribosome-binding GTPase [Deltaproteobacteria bacterium]|nr:50S ribosome-binding GTPase [Deltaproteobacteria bacterium]
MTHHRDNPGQIADHPAGKRTVSLGGPPLPHPLFIPGLGPESGEAQGLAGDLPKRLAAFAYKAAFPEIWVVFLGGTGTGKSTLFNALCGRRLSETGVERPKTQGAMLYAHHRCPLDRGFPFTDYSVERQTSETSPFRPAAGRPGQLLILDHDRTDFAGLVVADTPDLDSVEEGNRRVARDLFLLADMVVFVSSQEKYADEVPYRCLKRVIREETPYCFLLNKAGEEAVEEDVLELLAGREVSLDRSRIWLIPHLSPSPGERIRDQEAFGSFLDRLKEETSGAQGRRLHETLRSGNAAGLRKRIHRLLDLLGGEQREADVWFRRLETHVQDALKVLVEEEKRRFGASSRPVIQREIRRLFSRFDLLARPRRAIQALILAPMRFLGFLGDPKRRTRDDDLARIREQADPALIQATLDRLNRILLEDLSPADKSSPLFSALRDPDLKLRDEEIRDHLWREQDRLYAWLEARFQDLARELPRGKRWGIYSTSLLWGLLIVSFEIVAGGGFSLLDAALDSAVAPFLTKGSVELFAYREIQKIARDLAGQYEKALVSLVTIQRDRYRRCLESLMTPPEAMEALAAWERWMKDGAPGEKP